MPFRVFKVEWDHPDRLNYLDTESLEVLLAEEAPTTAWSVTDSMDNRTYCAFCGHEVALDDPDAGEKVLDHIRNCEMHPLHMTYRALRAVHDCIDGDTWNIPGPVMATVMAALGYGAKQGGTENTT